MTQNQMDQQQYLNIQSWRSNLSDAATVDLNKHLHTRTLRSGETLYHFGEAAEHGYQIVEGEISINSYTSDGRELVLETLSVGHCLGDIALVNTGLRFNNAVATCKTVVNSLSRKEYDKLCMKHPEIAIRMGEMMGYRFQFMYTLIQDACLLPLYERLGRVLIRMSLGQYQGAKQKTFTIEDCSQEKLGQMVGAARQSVGREMKKMESNGLIKIEYKSITVLDFDAMVSAFGNIVEYEPLTSAYFEYQVS